MYKGVVFVPGAHLVPYHPYRAVYTMALGVLRKNEACKRLRRSRIRGSYMTGQFEEGLRDEGTKGRGDEGDEGDEGEGQSESKAHTVEGMAIGYCLASQFVVPK